MSALELGETSWGHKAASRNARYGFFGCVGAGCEDAGGGEAGFVPGCDVDGVEVAGG